MGAVGQNQYKHTGTQNKKHQSDPAVGRQVAQIQYDKSQDQKKIASAQVDYDVAVKSLFQSVGSRKRHIAENDDRDKQKSQRDMNVVMFVPSPDIDQT